MISTKFRTEFTKTSDLGGGRGRAGRGTWRSSASKVQGRSNECLDSMDEPAAYPSPCAALAAKTKEATESDLSLDWDLSFSSTSRCQFNSEP